MSRECERCGETFSTDPDERSEFSDPLRCPSCGHRHDGEARPAVCESDDADLEVSLTLRVTAPEGAEIRGVER